MTPSALELRASIAGGFITATEACDSVLERIETAGPRLNAFITVSGERARARAAELDRAGAAGLRLAGVPIAVKDNICTRGVRTTAGSRILEHHVPLYDATVIERLEAAGALVVAKTNCDEFAMGSSSEHSAFGAVRNPWDVERTAGGSSGGSAVAVAARLTPLALGSETGGSVRQPAALCGIVGMKPTYGRVPRYGLIAFASSLDQVGAFGTTVADVATCLAVIAGHDPRDATSGVMPVDDYVAATRENARGLRVGVPRALVNDGVDAGVRRAFDEAIDVLRDAGAEIGEVTLPHSRYATATYAIVVMAEASSNLGRFDGVRYGSRAPGVETLFEMYSRTRALFGHEVKRRIMLGTYVLSAGYYEAYYLKAQKVRMLIRQDFERAFGDVDVIATPTSPTTAFKLGEKLDDPVQMYLADVFTVSANLAGIPAISVPCGFADGLPVGLQLTGRAWEERTLFRAAAAYERLTPW
ncbi:MAG: Asp-tRNA(Asn)/Glu-tRNA(Gln) amidotransferase subunit GatA, partial [Acidobacteria bacterium]|nr:Asp-tRNA(Asn)/Glu-tRNA(Gln) amidotransferase subunit GatA [Acidobacteriota bacterium]